MATEAHLLLFHTAGCHLCELAEALALPLAAARGVRVELQDIAGSEELEALYGTRIPVLRDPASSREIGWPFGEREVLALLEGL